MTEAAALVLKILGTISLLYLAVITFYCGFFPAFSWFWAGVGLFGITIGCFLQFLTAKNSPHLSLFSGIMLGAVVIGMLTLLFSFVTLYSAGNKKAGKGADYLIVLGAKVKGCVPTRALQGRIEKAFDYLKENPETKVVLTGGQGPGEDISESSCMEQELLAMGIEKERIYKEEKSTTTLENIAYAGQWISDKKARVIIVTSDFHVKRGVTIAKEAGYEKVEGLGDRTVPVMRLHYYTRETLAWVNYGLHCIRK